MNNEKNRNNEKKDTIELFLEWINSGDDLPEEWKDESKEFYPPKK